ncbi:ankyrin repeat-containing protein BDA1-like [Macadamia integrifolia]|uniref:ankyrin repeat-containing protein BDA1-like n=1 Tax=Macadamia integrifolia TaxID=60698 RepID=UPI001C4E582B|nr:ankyrin repeat-containing protein BDA1-like [Macadamia integrifolia]
MLLVLDICALHALLAEEPLILERATMDSGENPLHIASLAGQTDFVKEIISRKPGFASELNEHGFSPMHVASAMGHVEIVRELLKIKNDICLLKGRDGRTPLHCATIKGRIIVIKELISTSQESVRELTVRGETALHLAVKNNQSEAFEVLVEGLKQFNKEIINWKDENGNTVLHLAVSRKQREASQSFIINMLHNGDAISNEVEVNALNSSSLTPLDVSDVVLQGLNEGEFSMVEKLVRAGAKRAQDVLPQKGPAADQVQPNKPAGMLLPPPCPWNLWRELTKEIGEASNEKQSGLMVVAVLIATVTYQAILSPPSGFTGNEVSSWSQINAILRKGSAIRQAVMARDPEVFAIFTLFNTIGFFASMGMICLLTIGFPLRAGLRLAMVSMTATYICAVFYIAPTRVKTLFTVVTLVGIFVLFELVRFTLWLLKVWGILPSRRRRA